MQKHVNFVDVVKRSFPTNIFLQNLASIQQRTSLTKFDHLDEKSEEGHASTPRAQRSRELLQNTSLRQAIDAYAVARPAVARREQQLEAQLRAQMNNIE